MSPIPTPVLTGSGSEGSRTQVSGSCEPPLRLAQTIEQTAHEEKTSGSYL
jgi:hypothetical protein